MAICYLCRGKELVQVKDDTVGGIWPCPKCRVQEFHVRHKVTTQEVESFGGSASELLEYHSINIRRKFIESLLDVFDVVIEVEPITKERLFKMDLWVVLPKTKGG